MQDIRRPFGELAREFLGDFLAFDARIWRTLAPLATRPGRITRDTIEGRRARYVPPFRLYVFAGFVYFSVMALTGGGVFAPRIRAGEEGTVISFGGAAIQTGISTGAAEDEPDRERETTQGARVAARFDERAAAAARDQEAFARALIGSFSYGHFLLMPIFALLLEAFYRGRFYVEHLVFSLHFHAFLLFGAAVLVAGSALVPGGRGELARRILVSGWTIVLIAYLFLALRTVYGQSRRRTAWKLVPLGFGYALISGIVVLAVAAATVWFY